MCGGELNAAGACCSPLAACANAAPLFAPKESGAVCNFDDVTEFTYRRSESANEKYVIHDSCGVN